MLKNILFILAVLSLAISNTPPAAAAQPVLNCERCQLPLKAVVDQETLELTILQKSPIEPVLFSLKNPARIVIDLPGVEIRKNSELTFAPQSFATSLRLGKHLSKTRLVIDLKDESLRYSWSKERIGLVIKLHKELPARTTAHPTASPATPTPLPTQPAAIPASLNSSRYPEPAPTGGTLAETHPSMSALVSPELAPAAIASTTAIVDTLSPLPTVAASAQLPIPSLAMALPSLAIPEIVPSAIPSLEAQTSATTAESAGQALRGITFDYLQDHVPVIKLALAEHPNFTIVRRTADLYQITFTDCGVAEPHLLLPYFPPFDFEGFNLVQAEKNRDGISISIGVDRDLRISAVAQGSEVWIQTAR